MPSRSHLVLGVAFTAGAVLGAALMGSLGRGAQHAHASAPESAGPPSPGAKADEALAKLGAEVETLKAKAVDQAHVMVSVAYHFNNLWFAAQQENWELAQFYWNETRSHLRWAVRVIPVRKDSAGKEIDLKAILQAVENSPLNQLQEAIREKDPARFGKAYRFMLEGCYDCHKAADKPYLRPQVPSRPAEPMMQFEPPSPAARSRQAQLGRP